MPGMEGLSEAVAAGVAPIMQENAALKARLDTMTAELAEQKTALVAMRRPDVTGPEGDNGVAGSGRKGTIVRSKFVPSQSSASGFKKSFWFDSIGAADRDVIKQIMDSAKTGQARQILSAKLKTLSEGDNEAGGFTVDGEFLNTILEIMYEDSQLFALAQKIQMGSESISAPQLVQTFGATPQYFGGVTFAWQDEASTINESTNPSYQLRELHARKLVALHKVTKELMADSPGFMTHLVNLLGRAAAYEVDAKLWSGNGTTQPLGHLNATGVITASRTTSSRFKVFDLETLDSGLDEAFTEGYLFMRKATQADLINDVHVPYSGAGATDGLPRVQIVHNQIEEPLTRRRQLNGYPVIITKHAPALGTTGDVTLMDPRSILVGVRETFEISTSTEAYWTTDILGVKLTARMDAQPIYPAGVVHLT